MHQVNVHENESVSAGVLADLLEALSRVREAPEGLENAVDLVREALGATAVVVVREGSVLSGRGPDLDRLTGWLQEEASAAKGVSYAKAEIGAGREGWLIASSDAPLPQESLQMMTAVARAFGLALSQAEAVDSLRERQLLLERLTRIQRSISHRAPLQEVLDAITQGAHELLGDEVVGLRLVDPEDPEFVILASAVGVTEEQMKTLRRGSVKEGAGGRAIAEDRLVIIDDYETAPTAIAVLASDRLQAAMAAPVREYGRVVGSLVVATYHPGRRYSEGEQEALLSLAEHTSLALTDAKTVEAMREAEHAKDMFLAMVSHELKTPLTVIMGALRTLQKHLMSLRDDVREDIMNSAVQRGLELQKMIDRLLQGARAELSEATVARRREFLPALVDEAVRGFEQQRPLEIDRVPSVFVHADRSVIHKVLGILLENAVSHSSEDSSVRVCAVVEGDSIGISVKNRGELPQTDDRADLFLPFRRGPQASSSGVGLGLYIASRLATAIGGGLDADDSDGDVIFTFTFPAGT